MVLQKKEGQGAGNEASMDREVARRGPISGAQGRNPHM